MDTMAEPGRCSHCGGPRSAHETASADDEVTIPGPPPDKADDAQEQLQIVNAGEPNRPKFLGQLDWHMGDPRDLGKMSGREIIVYAKGRAVTGWIENHHGYHVELAEPGIPGSPHDRLMIMEHDKWPEEYLWCWPPQEKK